MDKISEYLSGALIDSGVAILSSKFGVHNNLMTVSFYAETSHVPVLVRVSVAKQSYTHDLISKSHQFGLSVLTPQQKELALFCGSHTGRNINKIKQENCAVWETKNAVLLLKNALAASACQVVDSIDIDSHTIFVAEIKESYRQSKCSANRQLLVSDLIDYLDNKGINLNDSD